MLHSSHSPTVQEDTVTVIYCTDCDATSATTFISVEDELCNDCATLEAERDNA